MVKRIFKFELEKNFNELQILLGILLLRAKRSDLISKTNFFQRDTWSVQTLINLFLETGGPGAAAVLLGANICRQIPPRGLGISKRHLTGWIQLG